MSSKIIFKLKNFGYLFTLMVQLLESPLFLCPAAYCACNFQACSHGVLRELEGPQSFLFWLNQGSFWMSRVFQYGWALLRAFYISSSPNLDFWWIEGSSWCSRSTLWCSDAPKGIALEHTKTIWSCCHCCCLWMSASIVFAQFYNFIRGFPCRTYTRTLLSKVEPCFLQTEAALEAAGVSQRMSLCSIVL